MTRIRDVRSLFLQTGGALAALALCWFIGGSLAHWRADRLTVLEGVRTEVLRLGESNRRLRAEIGLLSGPDLDHLRWHGEQVGQVTATVQSQLSSQAARHGVQLRSITPSLVEHAQLGEVISFRLEFEARLDQFVQLLASIEFATPALVIEQATLRRTPIIDATAALPTVFVQIDLIAPITVLGEQT